MHNIQAYIYVIGKMKFSLSLWEMFMIKGWQKKSIKRTTTKKNNSEIKTKFTGDNLYNETR